jgi:uncharacterized delta-60 repeat protein
MFKIISHDLPKVESIDELKTGLKAELKAELNAELGARLNSELGARLHNEIGSRLHSELGAKLNNELGTRLHRELGSRLNNEIGSRLTNELGIRLHNELGSRMHSELGPQLKAKLSDELDAKVSAIPLKSSCNNNSSNQSDSDAPYFDDKFGANKSGFVTTDVSSIVSAGGYLGDSGALFNIIKSGIAVVSFKNGSVSNSNTRNVAVLRYLSNGSGLDTSFGTNGIFSYNFTGSGSTHLSDACVTGAIVDTSGRIIVSGFVVSSYHSPYVLTSGFLIRLNSNGSLDTGFNGTGVATLTLGASINSTAAYGSGQRFAIFTGVKIQNGNIVVAGSSATAGAAGTLPFYFMPNGTAYNPRSILIARFNSSGVLDTSFGTAGTGVMEMSYNSSFSYSGIGGLDLYNDGSILVGGYQSDSNNDSASMDTMFAKFTSNGAVDTSFNNGTTYGSLHVQGVVVYPIPTGQSLPSGIPSQDSCYAVRVDHCNKVIGAGVAVTPSISIENMSITGSEDFSIVRLNPDGSLDTTFNNIGYNLVQLSTGIDAAWGVDVDHEGNVDAVGYSVEPTTNFRKLCLAQLNKSGAINYTVSTNSYLSSGDNYASGCIAVDRNKMLVAITARNNNDNDLNAGVAKFEF